MAIGKQVTIGNDRFHTSKVTLVPINVYQFWLPTGDFPNARSVVCPVCLMVVKDWITILRFQRVMKYISLV